MYSSLADTTGISKDKYQHVYHFASKAHALNFARTEYPELVAKTSVVQIGGYLSNFITAPGFAPTKNEASGKYEFIDPFPEGVKIPLIAAEEDTGPLVRALIEEPSVKNLLGVREWMSIKEFASIWSKTLHKEIEIKDPKDAPMPQGLDEEAAALMQEMGETMQFIVDFGFAGETVDKTVSTPDKVSTSNLEANRADGLLAWGVGQVSVCRRLGSQARLVCVGMKDMLGNRFSVAHESRVGRHAEAS